MALTVCHPLLSPTIGHIPVLLVFAAAASYCIGAGGAEVWLQVHVHIQRALGLRVACRPGCVWPCRDYCVTRGACQSLTWVKSPLMTLLWLRAGQPLHLLPHRLASIDRPCRGEMGPKRTNDRTNKAKRCPEKLLLSSRMDFIRDDRLLKLSVVTSQIISSG